MRQYGRLTWLLMLALLGSGCGVRSATVDLKGEVSYNGQAIEKGRIEFIPVDGTSGPSAGATIDNGHYALPAKHGLLGDGTYQVKITAFRKTGKKEPNRIERSGPPVDVTENFIPPTYNVQSTLKVRVSDCPDKDRADFHIGIEPPATK
jgi:hypothetical protein